jgi:hypothetical protein
MVEQMRRSCGTSAIKALLTLAAAMAIATPAAATTGRGVLYYKVYFGGFAAAALEIDLQRSADDYRITTKMRTLGVIDQLFPWTLRSYSRGRLAGAEPRPTAAGQTSDWRGRVRRVDMRYADGRPIVERLAPVAERDDRTPIADEDLRGTVDLAGAILALSLDAEAGRECARLVPVFDGRRRYDLIAERVGVETIRRFGRPGLEPRALKCRLSMVRRAGYRRIGKRGGSDAKRRSTTIWLAPAGAGMPPLPMRVEIDTRWGLIIAHLLRVRGVPSDVTPAPAIDPP